MDRIEMIGILDPEWAVQISTFLDVFPEFQKYRKIACMTKKGITYDEWWYPKTMFEHCIYYPCAAGVRRDYAEEQFKMIVKFLRSGDWMTICYGLQNFLNTSGIQPKKQQIYWDIFTFMNNNGLRPDTLTIEHIERMKINVKGLGEGFIGNIREQFSDLDNVCQYTDIGYIKAFTTLYGSKIGIKQKSEIWMSMGFGRVANSFMFQIFHYGDQC